MPQNQLYIRIHMPFISQRKIGLQSIQSYAFSYISIEHHCFWYLNLSSYDIKQPTEYIPILKDISDPLYLVQALSRLLSTHKNINYEVQLEQDYITCLYFYFCFKQMEKLFKNKAVRKIKINNTLSSEKNDVLKMAVNLRKQNGDGNDENDKILRQVKSVHFWLYDWRANIHCGKFKRDS